MSSGSHSGSSSSSSSSEGEDEFKLQCSPHPQPFPGYIPAKVPRSYGQDQIDDGTDRTSPQFPYAPAAAAPVAAATAPAPADASATAVNTSSESEAEADVDSTDAKAEAKAQRKAARAARRAKKEARRESKKKKQKKSASRSRSRSASPSPARTTGKRKAKPDSSEEEEAEQDDGVPLAASGWHSASRTLKTRYTTDKTPPAHYHPLPNELENRYLRQGDVFTDHDLKCAMVVCGNPGHPVVAKANPTSSLPAYSIDWEATAQAMGADPEKARKHPPFFLACKADAKRPGQPMQYIDTKDPDQFRSYIQLPKINMVHTLEVVHARKLLYGLPKVVYKDTDVAQMRKKPLEWWAGGETWVSKLPQVMWGKGAAGAAAASGAGSDNEGAAASATAKSTTGASANKRAKRTTPAAAAAAASGFDVAERANMHQQCVDMLVTVEQKCREKDAKKPLRVFSSWRAKLGSYFVGTHLQMESAARGTRFKMQSEDNLKAVQIAKSRPNVGAAEISPYMDRFAVDHAIRAYLFFNERGMLDELEEKLRKFEQAVMVANDEEEDELDF